MDSSIKENVVKSLERFMDKYASSDIIAQEHIGRAHGKYYESVKGMTDYELQARVPLGSNALICKAKIYLRIIGCFHNVKEPVSISLLVADDDTPIHLNGTVGREDFVDILKSMKKMGGFLGDLNLIYRLLEEKGSTGLGLNKLAEEALETANSKGFTEATFAEDIALVHSELSEALEYYREGKNPSDLFYVTKDDYEATSPEEQDGTLNKPCGIPSELADVMIRILHICGKNGINIERAMMEKMAYNKTRPHKHGKVM